MKAGEALNGSETGNVLLRIALAIVLLCSGFAGMLLAQDKPADNMQLVLEKIKADKKLLVAENMQLTEAEATAFWPLYEQYQDELFLLRVRTAKLIKDYTDTYKNMNDATAQRLLHEYINIETLRLKLHKAYLPKFREVLPGAKMVRYYQIENRLNTALEYELSARIPLATIDQQ